MDVGARHTVRGHRCPARIRATRRPIRDLLWHKEIRINSRQLIRQSSEMQILRNRRALQRENRLHQAENSGGRLGVAEVRLHRGERAGACRAVHLTQACVFNGIAYRCARAVRLDHSDGPGVHTRSVQRSPVQRGLRRRRRCRDIHGVAVLVGGRATDHRKDSVAVAQCVRQALEQHHRGGFAAHVPVRRHIEGMTASGGGQVALRRPGNELARFQHHIGATGECQVAFAVVEAAAAHVHRHEAGRTGGVEGQRGTVQSHRIGDPARGHRESIALEPVRTVHRLGIRVDQLIIEMCQTHEHTRARFAHRRRGQTRMFHRLPRGFQQQAVLRIECGGLALIDTEEVRIEASNVVEERAPLRHRPAHHTRFGVVVEVVVPAIAGNLGHQIIARQQRVPQFLGRLDAARKPTGHADDSHRSGRCEVCPIM